jgi:DNA polymerase-1
MINNITLSGHPDLPNVLKLDNCCVPMLRRMHGRGIAIDIPYFNELSLYLQSEMDNTYADISSHVPKSSLDSFVDATLNVRSPDQIATLLFQHLGLGKGKKLKTTAKLDKRTGLQRISTDKKQLEQLKSEHPIIHHILRYKEFSTLRQTYANKLPKIARWDEPTKTWRVHTEFLLTRTDTSRLASKNVNLQNIPANTDLGRLVRAGFIATPGYVLVSHDYSQIELRWLAHLANESRMMEIFLTGGDLHKITASEAFQKPIELLTKDERTSAKRVNFGIAYSLTGKGLYQQLIYLGMDVDEPWCDNFILTWHTIYPGVQPYMDEQIYRARRYGYVWDAFGGVRLIPEVRSVLPYVRSEGHRYAGNQPIQSSAACTMKLAMAECQELGDELRSEGVAVEPLLTIHDDLTHEIEESCVEEVSQIIQEHMESCCPLRVPVTVDCTMSKRWSKGVEPGEQYGKFVEWLDSRGKEFENFPLDE